MMSLVALATTSDTINALFSLLLNGAVVWFLAVYVLCVLALLLELLQDGKPACWRWGHSSVSGSCTHRR